MSLLDRYLVWLLGAALATGIVAWMAFAVQQEGIAPAVLFPLAVGGILGAALWSLRRAAGVPSVRASVASAVGWGLLVVVGQDYIGHRHRVDAYREQIGRQAPLVALASAGDDGLAPRFSEYLTGRLRRDPGWWTLELVLTAGAAALVCARGASQRTGAQASAATEESA